ncbi:alpha/beta hydrolase [Aquiflexum gelatinilyticum]|uniref:Alpha/beta hydrolase n=1 Tax=Aquiflexum gelatinilyticum TaxID=2961943 RepID=A0A9X2SYP4_9BACT|nr:alpha/beta hydrolase [Aquiflexum gelatinilyticum]MCR9015424.1 alpha/beta hydrolase [Aquiflexum gelatinilyticum]MCS4435226.1 alpha/beta hydrolase [Aquiflexum gelatinilyticum]
MKKASLNLFLIFLFLLSSCSKKMTSAVELSATEKETVYQILKDVSYGSDVEQVMDIYLSQKAKSFGKRNYTIVFLHGGGYYFSDKSQEERYIEPYLKKGLNVVNLNYRLKRGIPLATSDLTNALNFLKANNADYGLNLKNVVVSGFSAGAHIATNVGLAQNNPEYPNKLDDGIQIVGIINFSGPVDGLDVVERIFTEHENEQFKALGLALFPAEGFESKENLAVFEPITYFDPKDPPIFLWHGGLDDQIPVVTFKKFIPLLRNDKDLRIFIPGGKHSPNQEEFENAYIEIFKFLDEL